MIRDFQDKLFELCCEYQEFRQYITGIDDLEECPKQQIVLDDFNRIMLDSLYISRNLDVLVEIEHQSSITSQIMFRNLKYHVNIKDKYQKPLQLHIFHTGLRIAPREYEYDNQIFHIPYLNQTYAKNGIETFKTIKNKIKNNETTPYDIFDFIWLPRQSQLEINDDFLREYIETTSKFNDSKFYPLLKVSTSVWTDRLTNNEKTIDYLKEKLNMISIDSPEFRDLRATAIYEREKEEFERKEEEFNREREEHQRKEVEYQKEREEHQRKEVEYQKEREEHQRKEVEYQREIDELKKQLAKYQS